MITLSVVESTVGRALDFLKGSTDPNDLERRLSDLARRLQEFLHANRANNAETMALLYASLLALVSAGLVESGYPKDAAEPVVVETIVRHSWKSMEERYPSPTQRAVRIITLTERVAEALWYGDDNPTIAEVVAALDQSLRTACEMAREDLLK